MGNERGITIIALVVTIVILTILIGVSLNIGLVTNGAVVKKVKNQTDLHKEMIEEEESKTNGVIKRYENEWGI